MATTLERIFPIRTQTLRRAAIAALIAILGSSASVFAAGGAAGGGATGADLGLSGHASTGSPQAGAPMSYIFQVKNSGPLSATSVTFTNRLHSGYVYHSATVNGRLGLCDGAPDIVGGVNVSCDLGTIAKGAQVEVVVNVDAPMSLGTYGIGASVASPVADPKTSDNVLLINVQVKNKAVATGPGVLSGPIYLFDSFGFDLFGNQTCWCRLDPAGLIVWIAGLSVNGLRAEYPNISSEVWATPDVHQMPTWRFAWSSNPSNVSPAGGPSLDGPVVDGVLVSDITPSTPSNNAALLPFVQPAGPVTLSLSIGSAWYTTAIGFTSSGALADNFETSGLAWFVIRMPTTPTIPVATAIWELHTNGFTGPSASGTMVLSGAYNHVAVSYDPTAGKVAASIEGVPVASLDYVVSGVQYVGFQGNGVVNDFLVQAGAIAVP